MGDGEAGESHDTGHSLEDEFQEDAGLRLSLAGQGRQKAVKPPSPEVCREIQNPSEQPEQGQGNKDPLHEPGHLESPTLCIPPSPFSIAGGGTDGGPPNTR